MLYDQTRRTPIVIPVINEIGGGKPSGNAQNAQRGNNGQGGEEGSDTQGEGGQRGGQNRGNRGGQAPRPFRDLTPKTFPAPVVPDTEVVEPKVRPEGRGY